MQELFSKGLHIQEILQLCMIHTCIKGLIHGHMVPLKIFFIKSGKICVLFYLIKIFVVYMYLFQILKGLYSEHSV